MSWFRSLSSGGGGDVFDENGDELGLQSKEWASNMRKRIRDGYVDGVDAGEDDFLQLGFKQGFMEGAAQTQAVGRLKGIVSAISCWCQIQHPKTPVPAAVADLLLRVSQHEDSITEVFRKTLENPPPSVSDVSESMEDLDVNQRDPDCGGEGCKEGNCCRRGDKMDIELPHQPQKLSSQSSDCSASSGENFNDLLQLTVDVVMQLGLPQELIHHIQDLKNI